MIHQKVKVFRAPPIAVIVLSASVLLISGCEDTASIEVDEPARKTVVRYRFDPQVEQARVLLNADGSVSYWAPKSVADSIQEGMTTTEVSEILRVDFFPEEGIYFPYYADNFALRIEFKDGKVSNRKIRPEGCVLPVW